MVFFRVDSNEIIAGGHVIRCIALANSFREIGEEVLFLIADSNPISVLNQYQLKYKVLETDWRDLMSDKEIVISYLKQEKKPILIIDTYNITKEYVESVKSFGKIIYLGSKLEYLGDLDMLINYSTDIDYKFYNQYTSGTKLLLGPSYAPLRDEFQNRTHIYSSNVKRVLITTGNTDPKNIVGGILEKVVLCQEFANVVFEVVIGRMFLNNEELHNLYDNYPNIVLNENVKIMSELIEECDLAISANGTTVYELSAMGIPTISFAMVEEQIKSAEALSKLGIVDYCGCYVTDQGGCINKIIQRLSYYLRNNDKVIDLATKAHNLIDGNGCIKIRNAILDL